MLRGVNDELEYIACNNDVEAMAMIERTSRMYYDVYCHCDDEVWEPWMKMLPGKGSG